MAKKSKESPTKFIGAATAAGRRLRPQSKIASWASDEVKARGDLNRTKQRRQDMQRRALVNIGRRGRGSVDPRIGQHIMAGVMPGGVRRRPNPYAGVGGGLRAAQRARSTGMGMFGGRGGWQRAFRGMAGGTAFTMKKGTRPNKSEFFKGKK